MKNIFLFIFSLILFSCTNKEETILEKDPKNKKEISNFKIELDTANFGIAKNLTEFKQTKFLPTLESKFDKNKNGIYAASLLFAWDEIRTALKVPIENIDSDQLKEINNSKTFENVLSKNEYNTQVEITDTSIVAKAYFKKLLPFTLPLIKRYYPLVFNNNKVNQFGFSGENYLHDIRYYKNDNDFAIQLNPKDREHQIILVLTKFKENSILKEWKNITKKMKLFYSNRNSKNHWTHYFQEGDKVSIPILNFNLNTNYYEIEGSKFQTTTDSLKMETVTQQIAFILDEKGAKVESLSEMSAAVDAVMEEKPKPKNLIFDKPFMIFLKRKDSKNPYFAAYISNTELMETFKSK